MAATTNASVRAAIGSDIPLNVYLQGSYRNTTNTRGNSDVDLIAEYNNLEPSADLAETWRMVRAYVHGRLSAVYADHNIRLGPNSIKLLGGGNRLNADVVPVLGVNAPTFHGRRTHGILFYNAVTGATIINFPKQHYDNGVAKHQATDQWYKAAVRMFKNARNATTLPKDTAPSYFVECLLYNAPDNCFGESHQLTFSRTLAWLAKAELGSLVCQNECAQLFGNAPTQWSEARARQFIRALADLWTRR